MEQRTRKIIDALIGYGRSVGPSELVFTDDPLIDDWIRTDAFAFLLAASVDRQMAAETAWRLPGRLRDRLGHLDPTRLSLLSEDEMLEHILQIDGKPRYPRPAAKTIVHAAKRVCDLYDGDARNIWRGKRAWEINRRLQEFYGIGPGIAAMVVNLLARLGEIELQREDYASMDVKPDVHVIRVFRRLGFVEGNSEQEAVQAARRLHPEHPAELDAPTWHIGRTWCFPQSPDCSTCPLSSACPRNGVA